MTIERDLDRRLVSFFEEATVQVPPHDLLARSLTRVERTGQRPGWLIGGGSFGRPTGVVVGRTFVPAWVVIAVALLAAVALVAVGSQLFTLPRPALIVDASPAPTRGVLPAPEPTVPAVPLGGRVILAEVFESPDVEGPHDLVSIDAGTSARTVLGSVPGSEKPIFSGAHPVSFQRAADEHVLILGGDAGQHVSQLTDDGRAFGFTAESDVPVDCCTEFGAEGMTLSPEGDRVAFLRVNRFDSPIEIVVLNLRDSTSSRVAIPATAPGEVNWFGLLSWSPDGSALLAYGCRPCNHAATPQERQTSHHGHLYILPLDGSSPRELGDVNNGSLIGQWASDGNTIVAAIWHCARGSHMPRCDPAEGDNSLGTIRIADGLVTDLGNDTADGTGLFEFKSSPDGRRVVYRTNDGLFVRSLDGAAPLKLADGGAFWADWSPDGQWILFTRNAAELWIVPSSGGDARLIGNDLAGAAW